MTIILSLFTLFLYKFDSTQVNRKMYMKCFVNYKGLRKVGNNRKLVRFGKSTAFFPVSLPELNFW